MPKFRLSATDVRQGGRTIIEIDLDKPSREAALSEGLVEILSANNFPPEPSALYREALARGFSRDEVLEQILGAFGLQFFIKEVADTAPAGPSFKPSEPTQQPALPPSVGGQFQQHLSLKPREILQLKFKQAKSWEADRRKRLRVIQKEHTEAKAEVDECRTLLRAKAAKKQPTPLRRVRKAGATDVS